ncbi:MAG: hypothetical protein PWQ54_2127 [Bacteroidales bacterium]|jgi:hypothetical protein|nr:hypothetical protein [Bacteroidales bacterium]
MNNEEKTNYIFFIDDSTFLVFEAKLFVQRNCGIMAFDNLRRDN